MIAAILKLITGGIWPYIAAGFAALAGMAALYVKGRADAKAKRKIQDLTEFQKTTERMQDADADLPDDPGVLRDWLRARDPGLK